MSTQQWVDSPVGSVQGVGASINRMLHVGLDPTGKKVCIVLSGGGKERGWVHLDAASIDALRDMLADAQAKTGGGE